MKKMVKGWTLVGAMLVITALLFCWCGPGQAAEESGGGESALLAKYPPLKAQLEKNQFGAPIYLDSSESGGSVRVDMYGVFNYPFSAVKEAVQSPANWCELAFLHLNTKACTATRAGDQSFVTIYSGRKYYQPPSEAYPLKLKFRVLSQQPKYTDIALSADEGPLGTSNHRMRLEAAPLDPGRTFVHFSYAYKYGSMARMATKTYFSTIGRDKVGFSVERKGGKNRYVEGERGAIERNTVRYYLALEAFIDTMNTPEGQRFEQRLSRWYDLTAKYPRQLKEVEKSEYLANKRRERKNEIKLQKNAGG